MISRKKNLSSVALVRFLLLLPPPSYRARIARKKGLRGLIFQGRSYSRSVESSARKSLCFSSRKEGGPEGGSLVIEYYLPCANGDGIDRGGRGEQGKGVFSIGAWARGLYHVNPPPRPRKNACVRIFVGNSHKITYI